MAVKTRIGVYFSREALSLIEMEGAKMIRQHHVPYDIFSKEEPVSSVPLSDEIKLTAVLQKTLRDNKIEASGAFVSIPTKDIILRSFFIPQMSKEEIVSAVEFEARKYIPFKLDELVYDFQATNIKEVGIRKLRILFVGMRKEILMKYLYVLEQSQIRAITLEPSPISLLRVLTQRKLISSTKTSVVIEVDSDEGNIIILERGLPQFIRDFKLLTASNKLEESEGDSSFIRLLNEVRVSLDYYRRQYPHGVFDKIIFCSERDIKSWSEDLQRELEVAVVYLKPQDVLGVSDNIDIGLLKAFGASLKDYVNLPVTINLSRKWEVSAAKATKKAKVAPVNIKSIIRWALAASAFVIITYLFNLKQVLDLNNQIKLTISTQSKFKQKKGEELKALIMDFNNKISTIKGIKSREYFTSKFVALSKLMPEGAWINNLDIQYNDETKGLNLLIKGSVYSEQPETHINIVNQFLNNLKSNYQFAKDFNNIELNSVNQSWVAEFRVTNFEINCR
ncbi:MAG: pilus assembly protein PilM [Candidatus Omnitrophota bacterium]|nr:pilus assembly protein PilM [Candidatus Omnitrophota bacterium]